MLKPIHRITTASLLFTGILLSTPALSAATCKGESQTTCSNSTSCYWVDAYKRSDGASVKGHCRAKPSASIKKSETKKAATKNERPNEKAQSKAEGAKTTKASEVKKTNKPKTDKQKTTSDKKSSKTNQDVKKKETKTNQRNTKQ